LNIFLPRLLLTVFFESDAGSDLAETLSAQFYSIFVDQPSASPAVSALVQGDPAGPFFRLVELDELCFLDWLGIKLPECFFMIASCHLTLSPHQTF
jgi:hypothetical protein